jgi:hypothetical protein
VSFCLFGRPEAGSKGKGNSLLSQLFQNFDWQKSSVFGLAGNNVFFSIHKMSFAYRNKVGQIGNSTCLMNWSLHS